MEETLEEVEGRDKDQQQPKMQGKQVERQAEKEETPQGKGKGRATKRECIVARPILCGERVTPVDSVAGENFIF